MRGVARLPVRQLGCRPNTSRGAGLAVESGCGERAPGLPADPGRTEIALAAGLAAAAGAVDVLAFTRMGQAFASIVTGNLVVVLLVLTGVWLATGGAPLGAAQYAALVAAALAMGLQSAAFRLVPVPGVTTTYFTGTLTSLLVGLATSGRLNVAALSALLALLAGAVLAGLLVAHAGAAAVLLPVALLAVVVAVSTVRRRELWVASGR